MVHAGGMSYSSYGAFELKAAYQRNTLLGMLCAATIGLIIGVVLWVIQTPGETVRIGPKPPVINHGVSHPIPRPTLPKGPTGPPRVDNSARGGVPHAVEGNDLDFIDTTTILSPSEYVYGDLLDSTGGSVPYVESTVTDDLPALDSFQVFEVDPEIIRLTQPEYPVIAKRMGLGGTVTIQVLVGKDGQPIRVIVGRSSGWPSLDEAALAGAFKNVYKPGIQNGRPVACWISYRVDFNLEGAN